MVSPWVATPRYVFCSIYAMLQRVCAGAEVQAHRQMARIWKTSAMPVPIGREEADPTLGPRDFVPRFGTKIRISEIAAEPEAFRHLTPAQAREDFKAGGNECTY